MILDQKRSLDDENHDEAVRLLVKLAKPTSVPNELSNLFKDPACTDLTTASSPFWILLRAVKDFVDADPNHLLPLTGSLPDMKATSKGYLKLSQLYRSKAQQDLSVVTQTVQSLLTDLGMPPDSIPPSDILSFVKHAAYIQVIRGTSYDDELLGNAPGKKSAERLQQEMDSDEESLLPWLVALRAAERFQLDNGRFPGDLKEHYDADVQNLPASARKILAPYGVSTQELPERVINACKEM